MVEAILVILLGWPCLVHAKIHQVRQDDLAPLYAVVGALMLAGLLYCCRQCCGQFNLDQPLLRGLELDDIVLEEPEDDRQELLERKERAHKLITRPTILSTAKSTSQSRRAAQSGQVDTDFHLDYEGYAEEKSTISSPAKSVKKSPVPMLNLSKASPAAAASSASKAPIIPPLALTADEKEEDVDMWKLWNSTYEDKNSGYSSKLDEEEKKVADDDRTDVGYKYKSIKFKKRGEPLPSVGQPLPSSVASSSASTSNNNTTANINTGANVSLKPLNVPPRPVLGAPLQSLPRPGGIGPPPMLDLAPLVRSQPLDGIQPKPRAPPMQDYAIKVSVQDYKYSGPSIASDKADGYVPMIASTVPRPFPLVRDARGPRLAPLIGRAPMSGRPPPPQLPGTSSSISALNLSSKVNPSSALSSSFHRMVLPAANPGNPSSGLGGMQIPQQQKPPPPRGPPPGYLLRNRSVGIGKPDVGRGSEKPSPPSKKE